MTGKLVLGLALLAGAALAFIAGLIAPEALRGPLKAWAAPLDRAWGAASASLSAPAAAASNATGLTSAANSAGTSGTASATTAGVASANAAGTGPLATGPAAAAAPSSAASAVPSSQLLLTPVVTANARYALQAGQFAIESQAQTLAASLRDRGAQVSVFNSQDKSGLLWAIVAIGTYGSSDEALRQRPQVQALLDAPVALAVIALPAAPAVPASPTTSSTTAPTAPPAAPSTSAAR